MWRDTLVPDVRTDVTVRVDISRNYGTPDAPTAETARRKLALTDFESSAVLVPSSNLFGRAKMCASIPMGNSSGKHATTTVQADFFVGGRNSISFPRSCGGVHFTRFRKVVGI